MRRVLVGLAAVPVLGALVLGVEVELARRGPELPDDTPLLLDGIYGDGPSSAVRHVVWLGDSTVAGVGASGAASTVPVLVAEDLGGAVQVHGLAISGARVGDVLDEQVGEIGSLEPAMVFVSVGANDTVHLTSVSRFRSRYQRLLRALPDGAEVVLLGVPDMGAPPRFAQPLRAASGLRGRRLDRVVREIARESGATYVDIAGTTGPAFRRDPDRYFAADRFHPSDAGYRLWAEAVLAAVRRPR